MGKKGQIAIFVLLGLVLIITSILIYEISDSDKTVNENEIKRQNLASDMELIDLRLFVEECVDYTAKNGLILTGKQGGFYNLKKPYVYFNDFKRKYYLIEAEDISPSLTEIENEISEYVENHLLLCLDNFTEFKNKGIDINGRDVNVNVSAGYDRVLVKTEMPLEIKKEGRIYRLSAFATAIDIPLGKIYNISREIVNLQEKENNKLCLSCLNDLTERIHIYIDVIEFYNDTVNDTLIFDLRAYNTSISVNNYTSYNFTFAIKYKGASCDDLSSIHDFAMTVDCLESIIRELGNEIILEHIPDFILSVGQEFYYDVNASGKALNFLDFTELFDINRTSGIIKFMPNEENIGEHDVWIKVFDKIGNEDYESFYINITK